MKSRYFLVSLLTVSLILGAGLAADAAKKPAKKKVVEGGQNQLKGLSGKMGEWLFNGATRFELESVSVVDAGPNDVRPNSEGKKFLVAAIQIKNANPDSMWYGEGHILTFVDKDDQSIQANRLVRANNWDEMPAGHLLPASGMKGVYFVEIDPTFVPVRCVYEVRSGEKVFRVALPTSEAK